MDHLAKRNRPSLFPIRVRCLCKDEPYISGKSWKDWTTYPERMGWKWEGHSYVQSPRKPQSPYKAKDTRTDSGSVQELLMDSSTETGHDAFLQRWLWFGLLEEVTAMKLDYSDFVLITNPLQRPLTEHEVAHSTIKRQLIEAGMTDLLNIPTELDSIPPGPILTTAKLLHHLLAWKAQMMLESSEIRHQRGITAKLLLRTAQAHVEQMCACWNGSFALDEPLPVTGPLSLRGQGIDQAIIFSILILIETLKDACAYVFGDFFIEHEDYRLAQPEILIRRFKKAGWCPNRIVWATSLGLRSGYVLSSSGMEDLSALHRGCANDVCNVNHVNESTYKTRHRGLCEQRSSGCLYLTADSSETVLSIVAKGSIPILYFDGTRLQVVSHSIDNPEFTAISHVWSDGLGNTRDNSLPQCQLEHLQRIVDDLVYKKSTATRPSNNLESDSTQLLETIVEGEHSSHSTDFESNFPEAPYRRKVAQGHRIHTKNYFWIDTLCIPLRPSGLRKAAIRQISDVFQRAAQVLVLDQSLQLSPHPESTPKFTLLRIGVPEVSEVSDTSTVQGLLVQLSCSSWMRRLWTFAEGALANELYVPLHDGFLLYDSLVWHAVHDQESILAGNGLRSLADELLAVRKNQAAIRCRISFESTQSFQFDAGLPEELQFPSPAARELYGRFCNVLEAIHTRNITKQEDESICIASAVNLPLNQLQEQDGPEQHMICLLRSLCFVPVEVLFLPVEKLKDYPGFGWAPSSFLTGGASTKLTRTPIGRVTDSGFLHECRAFTFRSVLPDLHPVGFMFKIRGDQNGQVFHVQKRVWEPWDVSEEFVDCTVPLFVNEILDRIGVEWASLPEDVEDIRFTRFALFTAVKTLGSHKRSIGAVARIVESESEPGELDMATDRLPAEAAETDANPHFGSGLVDNLPSETASRPLGKRAIKVKYEYAVTITTWPESRFPEVFNLQEENKFHPSSLDFFFVSDKIIEKQMWCVT